MRSLKHRIARFSVGLGLATTMALSAALPALADDGSLTISGGTLSLAAPTINAASGVTLNGLNTTTSYTINLDVNDPTGTGAGWNVTMTSTAFKGPDVVDPQTDPENAGKALANGTSTISARPTTACHSGSTCTLATDGSVVSYPYSVPAGTSAPTATKVYSAAVDTGLGRLDLTPTVTIAVPANTYAGVYTSVITLALVSAP